MEGTVTLSHRALAGEHSSAPGGQVVHEVKRDIIHSHPEHLRDETPHEQTGGGYSNVASMHTV